MDNHKKLEFIHKMAALGLKHFDSGGPVSSVSNGQNGSLPSPQSVITNNANPLNALNPGTVGGVNTLPILGGLTGGLSGATQQGTAGQQNPYVQSNATNPNTGIIGSIGGALGLNDNFQASSANVTPGTNAGQLSTAYNGAQNALAGQQSLANTLAPQASSAVANQNALANQFLAMSQGQGPNPAQAQLQQATAANTANQAALMAGQRGSSQNIGLLARQNAQQGAANQQQSAGQAASLGAQQQINAQNNLANLSNAQIGQTGQAATNLSSAAQGEQGILQNANTGFNNSIVGMQSNINNVNSQTAAANQNMAGNIMGSISGPISSGISSLFAEGGEVDQQPSNLGTFTPSAAGSDSGPSIPGTSTLPTSSSNPLSGGSSGGGGGKSGGGGGLMSLAALLAKGGPVHRQHFDSHLGAYFADGGKVSAMVSPGEIYLSPDKVHKVMNEGANPLKIGHRIPGKAKVKGDSYSNDTVPANLDEGGVVIDRKNSIDPHKAALFVHQSLHKRRSQM
jgi:hypothetical protein